jgi:hypothetical protein
VIFKIYFRFPSLNPELVICNLDPKIKPFDLTIEKVEDMFLLKENKKTLQLEPFYRFYFTPVKM